MELLQRARSLAERAPRAVARRVGRGTETNGPAGAISARDFAARQPLNRGRGWLRSRVIADRLVPGLAAHLPVMLCTLTSSRDGLQVVRLRAYPKTLGKTAQDLLDLIRTERRVRVVPVKWGTGEGLVVSWDGETFWIDGEAAADSVVLSHLDALTEEGHQVVVRAGAAIAAQAGDALRLTVARGSSDHASVLAVEPRDATGSVSGAVVSPGLTAAVEELLSQDATSFRLVALDVLPREGGDFRILDILPEPPYPHSDLLDEDGWDRLTEAVQDAPAVSSAGGLAGAVHRTRQLAHRARRRVHAFQLRSTGFSRRMALLWVKQINNDNRRNADIPSYVRARHHRAGFVSTTVSRFGITPENQDQFISNRDYLLAEPLNETYGKWVRDRVSSLTVFEPFAQHFETMHYQVMQRDGGLHVVPLTALARECGTDANGLAALLQRTGPLAMGAAAWSGRRPRVLGHTGESFTVDGREYSRDEFEALLTHRVRSQFFVLYEPVTPSGPLTELVTGGDVQLQVTMMNPGGGDPQVAEAFVVATDEVETRQIRRLIESGQAGLQKIGGDDRRGNGVDTEEIDAYLSRIEHRADAEVRSDATARSWLDDDDDTAESTSARLRLESRIDADTGTFDGARTVLGGQLWSLESHPSTGRRYEGRIEEWDSVRSLLMDLCAFAPQLKFVQIGRAHV